MTSKRAESKKDMPQAYLSCRSFRHELRFVTDSAVMGTRGKVVEFTRETTCVVCGVHIRTTFGVPDFRVKKRTYTYPDNYRVKGGYPVFDARSDYVAARFSKKV